ncbi:MAG: tetratricopeptide repeat protein [Calditrichia bacterium]
MNLSFFTLLAALIFTAISTTSLLADDKLPQIPMAERATKDSLFHEPLSRGINLVYEDKFAESIAIFDSLLVHYPQHPAPYFYKAAAYQTWMSSYRFNGFQKELEENVQKAIDTGTSLLEKTENDPWLNFYIGAAYGYRAFFKLRSYNFIGAYRDGTRGIDNFKIALEKDPKLYDVYLGLGSYHYWRTARSKFIRIIAFWMRDKRNLGIDQMRFSIDHGQYCPAEASLVLVTALYDYKKYDEALAVLTDFMQSSETQVISSYYMLGRLHLETEDWLGAEESFTAVLTRLEQNKDSAKGYQAECYYWIAQSHVERSESLMALQSVEKALELARQRDKKRELESQFESFNDIHSKLKKLHKTLKKDMHE